MNEQQAVAEDVVATTSAGRVRGRRTAGISAFKGVPYGASTAGAGRFKPPARPQPWTGVRDALAYGPRAWQDDNASSFGPEMRALLGEREKPAPSEDCLVLNLWTPGLADGGKRPVMLWLHGGAFVSGSGAEPWNEGHNLARSGDVVVVAINHRLGALGYLHLGDLGGADYAASGIAGMLDIVAALEWVRDNAASFGGDPGNVTIFGESGGGAKVCVLMALPAARGLFHKAIVQSGPAVEMMSTADATNTARQVMAELGLAEHDVGGLVATPAGRVIEAQAAVLRKISALSFANRRRHGFNPAVDGTLFPGGPFAPGAPAISAQVPLMIGTNKDEMIFMLGHAPWFRGLDEAGMIERARVMVGDAADRVIASYRRLRPTESPSDLLIAIATDLAMRMPSLTIADRKAAQGAAPVYVYLFTWETPVLEGRLKSLHTLEIPFVFDNVDNVPLTGDSPARYGLARAMSKAWIEFAHRGDPNHAGLPDWPTHSSERRPTMVFDLEPRMVEDPYRAERLVWSGE